MPRNKDPFCAHCGSPTERMFSIKSAAKLTDCSERFYRNLVRDNEIGYKKIRGMVRIPYSQLALLIEDIPSTDEMIDEILDHNKTNQTKGGN